MKLLQTLFFLIVIATSGFAQKPSPPKLHKEADFTLPTPAGENLQLSSLRGQFVLVDFWGILVYALQGGNTHLKELYAQYHAAGLEIVSVSIDAHAEAWKRAMEQEQMPWKQVMDTYSGTGDFSDVAGGYGVKFIPYTLLLDKEGKAIAINPEPHTLDKQLKKLFGN